MDLKMMRRLSSQSTRTNPQNYGMSSGAVAGGGGGEKRSGLNMNMVGSMGFLVGCLMALSLLIAFGVVFRDQPSHQMPMPDVPQSQTTAFKQKPQQQPGSSPKGVTTPSWRDKTPVQVGPPRPHQQIDGEGDENDSLADIRAKNLMIQEKDELIRQLQQQLREQGATPVSPAGRDRACDEGSSSSRWTTARSETTSENGLTDESSKWSSRT
ncbi:hypothetical protein CKAN_00689100 [Cinnamomum micranthum f. kanehirae]|uniref:Uncharacterized protein n=1 Tax=Cinnamomum micranthum f. kanehirae TaxID=337451 RepID=A0A3S3MRM2_9MAGN|nr:hypothetical protein CKAN_00689100 [Cinnamomum micranthum f. kanehirae]